MNIIAKHDGQATVASREPQNWQDGTSAELAAPQFGQLSVTACMNRILAAGTKCGLQDNAVRFCPRNSFACDRLFSLSLIPT
jgi:hypothetical protein